MSSKTPQAKGPHVDDMDEGSGSALQKMLDYIEGKRYYDKDEYLLIRLEFAGGAIVRGLLQYPIAIQVAVFYGYNI